MSSSSSSSSGSVQYQSSWWLCQNELTTMMFSGSHILLPCEHPVDLSLLGSDLDKAVRRAVSYHSADLFTDSLKAVAGHIDVPRPSIRLCDLDVLLACHDVPCVLDAAESVHRLQRCRQDLFHIDPLAVVHLVDRSFIHCFLLTSFSAAGCVLQRPCRNTFCFCRPRDSQGRQSFPSPCHGTRSCTLLSGKCLGTSPARS